MSFSDNPFDANERGECSILVVDDNHEVLEALRRVLEAHHYRVQCATTAGEAQRLLLKNPPNLILSDLLMPDKDGFSFYEHVRKSTVLHDIPFIILTGAESPELRLQAHREGCDDYLLKPIDPDELLAVVEGKLQRARQLKEVSARRMQVLHRRIIHTLSHEFRTPLVSIQAGAELLSERIDAEGDPTAKLVLDAIHEGGKRLQRLVEDFMLLQQLDLGLGQEMPSSRSRAVTGLAHTTEETVENFVAQQRRGNTTGPVVRMSVVGEEQIDDVDVVREYLSDVLLRLLENALKFGGSQAIDVTVVLSTPYAEIIIRDYGPGFLEDRDAERVFEPFLQIKRDIYEQQGCGVGLTIARFLAQLNGSELHFSAPQSGPGVEAHIVIQVHGVKTVSVEQPLLEQARRE